MKYRRHSLSHRLIWIFLGTAVLLVLLVGGAMSLAFKSGFEENLRPHLVRYLEYLQADLGSPPDLQRAEALAQRLPVEIHIIGAGENWSSSGMPPKLDAIHHRHEFEQNGNRYQMGNYKGKNYLFSFHDSYTLAFSIPHSRGALHWRMGIPILLLLLVLMLLHHATQRLLSPIKILKSGAERIGQGNLDHRVNIQRKDELGELANSFNSMADDIQQMLESKRQLLLAISHELRSPLTRTKLLVEMLEDEKQREELGREVKEMQQLIEELLETERLSSRHRILNREETPLVALTQNLINESFSGSHIDLSLPGQELTCLLDPVRIKLLFKNLIGNALQHSGNHSSPPQVELKQEAGGISFRVKDFGRGIDEEHLPFLTEPFYRVDPARQHQTGSYGLGLYLCRMLAEAHDGSLEVTSRKGMGSEVAVRFPCK